MPFPLLIPALVAIPLLFGRKAGNVVGNAAVDALVGAPPADNSVPATAAPKPEVLFPSSAPAVTPATPPGNATVPAAPVAPGLLVTAPPPVGAVTLPGTQILDKNGNPLGMTQILIVDNFPDLPSVPPSYNNLSPDPTIPFDPTSPESTLAAPAATPASIAAVAPVVDSQQPNAAPPLSTLAIPAVPIDMGDDMRFVQVVDDPFGHEGLGAPVTSADPTRGAAVSNPPIPGITITPPDPMGDPGPGALYSDRTNSDGFFISPITGSVWNPDGTSYRGQRLPNGYGTVPTFVLPVGDPGPGINLRDGTFYDKAGNPIGTTNRIGPGLKGDVFAFPVTPTPAPVVTPPAPVVSAPATGPAPVPAISAVDATQPAAPAVAVDKFGDVSQYVPVEAPGYERDSLIAGVLM